MARLWFVVPVHGRTELAAVCLRQLARTCDELEGEGLEARAVVIADRANIRALRRRVGNLIGRPATQTRGRFATIERDNEFVSRRFNDGIELACSDRFNPEPADYVVPCGSDDWIDHRIMLQLPRSSKTIVGFQRLSFVREDAGEIMRAHVRYLGGCGIRIYPARLLRELAYRPADESRSRGCDTSILVNVTRAVRNVRVLHADIHDRQIVDWKLPDVNLNTYAGIARYWSTGKSSDPFEDLAETYPAEALEEMREVYGV